MNEEPRTKEAAKKTWHTPRLVIYGDPLELTESVGTQNMEDGGGTQYAKLKTA